MGNKERQFLRRLEQDNQQLRIRLKGVWDKFVFFKQALRRAIDSGNDGEARTLVAQIKTLIDRRSRRRHLKVSHWGLPFRSEVWVVTPGRNLPRRNLSKVIVIDAKQNSRLADTAKPLKPLIVLSPSAKFDIRCQTSPSSTPHIGNLTIGGGASGTRFRTTSAGSTNFGPFADDDRAKLAAISTGREQRFGVKFLARNRTPRDLALRADSPTGSAPTTDDDQPSAPTVAPPTANFQFRLEGDGARGQACVVDGDVDLVFFLGEVRAGALARLEGECLEAARRRGGRLGVMVVPVGFDLRADCLCHQIAQLVAGGMDGEIRFQLKAGPMPGNDAGTWAYLDLDGVALGSFFLPIPIVTADSAPVSLLAGGQTIDLDTEGQPASARLTLTREGDALRAGYANLTSQLDQSGTLPQLTPASLSEALKALQNAVATIPGDPIWLSLNNPFEKTPNAGQSRTLDEMFLTLAKAGWALWNTLTADPALAPMLKDIDRLPLESRLAVLTNSVFIPWELIYPENPELQQVKPALFWGARYLIQATQLGASAAAEKREHQNAAIGASLWVNPAIDKDFTAKGLTPAASHHDWAIKALKPLAIPWDESDPITARTRLIRPQQGEVYKWIYVFCHGRSSGVSQEVDLGSVPPAPITPNTLLNTPPFVGRPIIFLNACSSGAASPLALVDFYTAFRDSKKALGLVGTSFPVPTTTAAAIGQEVSRLYLSGSHDLASALFAVRRDLIDRRIPIGLFYTLHAPGDVWVSAPRRPQA